ncbi:MAG: T9SS type B sorting domain-containing protein [Saprospiraceae bacterium]|nr:T9SS type B sorting domain-containing protein [Saprospiraceae bacterium]
MKLRFTIFFIFFYLFGPTAQSQNCPFDNILWTDLTPSGPGMTATDACVFGGDLITVSVISGETYVFSTCGTTTVDVTMTLYNTAGTVIQATDDDGCGNIGGPAIITWIATFTGVANLLIDEYPCLSGTSCINLDVTRGGSCSADVGTQTVLVNGTAASSPLILCKGDCFDVLTDSNFILPPPTPGESPELMYGLYTGIPNLSLEPDLDPNFSSLFWTGDDFTDCNNSASIVLGALLPNNFWLVPITMDDSDNDGDPNGIINYDNNNDNCFAMGTPIEVVYLDDITGTGNENCTTGTTVITLTGGYPSHSSSGSYTVTNAGPGVMVQSGAQGETLTFSGYTSGQTLMVSITDDGNGCTGNVTFFTTCATTCAADAGTVTSFINGNPATSPLVLCKGDCYDIITDSNFVLPPPTLGEAPELMYAIYTGVPNLSLEPDLDPNFSSLFWTGDSFSDCNNDASIVLGASLPTNVWFVPITMDDGDDNGDPNGVINYDNNNDTCYAMGTPIELVFLDLITGSITENCTQTTISLSGGLPGHDPASLYTVTNTGSGTMVQSGSQGETLVFTGYTPGQVISVSVVDGNGCATNINVNTTSLPLITLDSITNVSCNGGNDGAIDVTVVADTADCTYTLDMFDSFGDGWEGSYIDAVVNGVSVGNYSVGTSSASATIVVPHGQSLELIYNYGGGMFETDVSYNLVLGGVTIFSDGPSPTLGSVFTTTCIGAPMVYSMNWSNGVAIEDISGLTANSYTLTVTDPRGCQSISGPHLVSEPPVLNVNIDSFSDESCTDLGSVSISVTGGIGPYTYNWSNGSTVEDISGLAGGSTYTVTVSDANGCTATNTSFVNTLPGLLVTASVISNYNGSQISCNGAADGEAYVQEFFVGPPPPPFPPPPPLGYLWSDGQTTAVATGLGVGTYIVTVTNGDGCTDTASVTILSEPSPVLVSVDSTINVDCFGDSTGSIFISASGGTGVLAYSWSNGSTSEDVSGLTSNVYTVTVSDNNGCTATSSITITEPGLLSVAIDSTTNPSCNGILDGSVYISVSGGTTAYSYIWSNAMVAEDLTGLASGNYSVTVSDANGCTDEISTTLIEPNSILITIDSSLNTACSDSSGILYQTTSGGTGVFSYSWSNGATTEDISGLTASSYTITVTDNSGCTSTASGIVSNTASGTIGFTTTNTNCNGSSDGCIVASVTGSSGVLGYMWSNGESVDSICGLAAGSYTLTITDTISLVPLQICTIINDTTIYEPIAVTISIDSSNNVDCNGGATASIYTSATGGTGTLTYNWSNGATTEDISGLSANIYTVTVSDISGCSATSGVTITEPAFLTVVVDSTSQGGCSTSIGAAYITASGGTGVYTYIWSNGSTLEDATGLMANTYTVTVTDNNSCTATTSVTITQSVAVSVTASVTSNFNGTDVSCFGALDGEVSATGSGGTSPFSFVWNNGQTTAVVSGLGAGVNQVTITDFNGCTATDIVTIGEPNTLAMSIDTVANVVCTGSANGFINISVSGGTGGIIYNWSNGSTLQDITGLIDSTYIVVVSDTNGCTTTDTVEVTTLGFIEVVVDSAIDVGCNGDSTGVIYTTATGDTSSTGCFSNQVVLNEIMYRPVNSNGVDPNTGEYIELIGPAGADIGCYVLTDGDWSITIPPGTTIPSDGFYTIGNDTVWGVGTFDLDAENCACFTEGTGGQSLLILTDGGEYIALYDDAGIFVQGVVYGSPTTGNTPGGQVVNTIGTGGCVSSVTIPTITSFETAPSGFVNGTSIVRDPDGIGNWSPQVGGSLNGCNVSGSGSTGNGSVSYIWSNGDSTQNISGLAAGTYTVTVTNDYGCTATTVYTLTEPNVLVASLSTTPVDCFGDTTGAIDLTVVGGTTPFSFNWSNGSTSEDAFNLPAGYYCVTATDTNGCVTTICDSILQPFFSLPADTFYICPGDSVQLLVNTNATVISWSPSSSLSNDTIVNPYANPQATTTYVVSASVGTGALCAMTDSIIVIVDSIDISLSSVVNVGCNGDSTGSIITSSGVSSYTYLWNTGNTTSNLNNLSSGTYYLTVSSTGSCQDTLIVSVTEPDSGLNVILLDSAMVSCNSGNDGSLMVLVTGGTPNYSYDWQPIGSTTSTVTGLSAGLYSLSVTDANNCNYFFNTSITEPSEILVSYSSTPVGCTSINDGTATAVPSGGTPGYSYLWDVTANSQTTAIATGLSSSTYSVTVTDTVGCTYVASGIPVSPSSPLDSTDVPLDTIVGIVDCDLNPIGVLGINTSGSYSYLWDNGTTTQNVSGLALGTYSVTITNSSGCTFVQTGGVGAPFIPAINPFINLVGQDSATVELGSSVDVDGGNDQSGLGVIYSWSSVSSDVNFGNDTDHSTIAMSNISGSYTLTITATATDSSGCDTSGVVVLNVQSIFNGMPDAFTPNGDGFNDMYFPIGLTVNEIITFRVFNRWSQEIYNGDTLENGGWDGRFQGVEQPTEVYLYLIEYNLGGGVPNQVTKGEFTLIR